MKRTFADKAAELFFDRKKLIVLGIFLLALTLRLIAANNLDVSADDVTHAYKPIGIFNSEKLVSWDQSTILWYYIQGIFYSLFGMGMIASRFAAALFGSLLVILIFLFTKKVFKSEKAAFLSSFLIALSPLLIRSTLPEMDVAVSFFTLFSAYFLFSYFEEKSNKTLILSSILIGIAVMIKLYALFFAFSFLFFLIYREVKTEKDYNKITKRILLFGLIITALVLPTLVHNYLLYQDKGYMDLIFTNTLGFGKEKAVELYSWSAGWMPYTDFKGFFLGNQRNFAPTPVPGFLVVLGFLIKADPILFLLSLVGLIYSYRKRKDFFWFYIITFLPAFLYLGAQIPMTKHFIWAVIFAAPAAGKVSEILLSKIPKIRLRHAFIFILLFSGFYLGTSHDVTHAHFYGKSSFGQLVDFKESQISENALVVVDSRIYGGNIHYGLAGTNYLEASVFFDAAQQFNSQGNQVSIETYFVECVSDDCGWGTVHNNPELNNTMEQTTAWFANLSYFSKDFSGPNTQKYYLPFIGEKETRYRVYKTDLALNPALLPATKQLHKWWFYPAGYDRTISPIYDDYNINGLFNRLLSKTAWLILYAEIIISFLTIIYILYLFVNSD